MLVPVILSGGVGSRLWPVSREGRPKQFLPLGGRIRCCRKQASACWPRRSASHRLSCNEAHRFLVAEQLREIATPASALILEPAGRNTAPAIALAAIQAVQEDPDAILLVLPADHHIGNPECFRGGGAAGSSGS
jgi:mannose-1-phosphate guanylyltransferase